MRYLFSFVAFLMIGMSLHAQVHHEAPTASHHEALHPKFRVASFISHTLIPTPFNESHAFIPSWGIDVEYWPSSRFGIGLHNDIELETFFVEGPEEELVEREYPIVSTLDALYRPVGGFILVAGVGYEFEKMDDFFILRFGAEYEFELSNHWDVFTTFSYDTSTGDRNYHTYTFGVGFGKRF
jgi:hypothetical protein